MPARWLGVAAALLGLAGCGGVAATSSTEATGPSLAIYSSLPLQGPSAPAAEQIVNGEKLALYQARGRAGSFKIAFDSLDDATPASARWSPGITASNAKMAAQDTSTIAYIGDFDSGATAVSLPLMNAAGILQLSPSSPYVGLTSSLDAGQFEPERFYPSGKRTFARLQPGDEVEAGAQAMLMHALAVHTLYVLDDQDPFQAPLATLTASAATEAGVTVAGHDSISLSAGAVYAAEIEKITKSGAQAVFLAAAPGAGALALWQQLHAALPQLVLLGSSSLAVEAFTSQLGSAASSTYLSTPLLPLALYPPGARGVLAAYQRLFGTAGGPEALYGYEAMSAVLAAIRRAGARGNDRQAVSERFLSMRARQSVLGHYSLQPDGETSITRYAIDRVSAGHPVFYRSFNVTVPPASTAPGPTPTPTSTTPSASSTTSTSPSTPQPSPAAGG